MALPRNAPAEEIRSMKDSNGVQLIGETCYFQVPQPWLESDQSFLLALNAEGALMVRDMRSPLPSYREGWTKVRTFKVLGPWKPHPEPRYDEQVAVAEACLTDGRVLTGAVVIIPSA